MANPICILKVYSWASRSEILESFSDSYFAGSNIIDLKTLVLVSEYYYPSNNAPAARFKPLVDSLSKYFAIKVFTSRNSESLKDKRIRCNWTPFPENTRSVYYRLILELIYSAETFVRLIFSRGDVYYITSPSFFNCLASYYYCRLFNRPYVVDVRDDYPRVFFDTKLLSEYSTIGKLMKSIEGRLYRHSIQVVAATQGLKNSISKMYNGDIYLLRNGFLESLFRYNPEKYDLFTLVQHGNLSSFQGIDTIIELAKTLEQYHERLQILIIGKGSDDYKLKSFQSEILKYLGPKSHHEVSHIIAKAHVGLSLRKEGKISEDSFPVRAYEYIGVCLPILVTPLSEAGQYVQQAEIGFQFDEFSVAEIRNKIIELMEYPAAYARMVENLQSRRLEFSREALSDNFAQHLIQRLGLTTQIL